MFKLTSLNLNGIRSAHSKGVEAWIAKASPDCICVQEVKAQAADVEGRFEQLAGLQGYFHFAQKKGYSGVAVYSKHTPRDLIVGYGPAKCDPAGRWLQLRLGPPQAVFHRPRSPLPRRGGLPVRPGRASMPAAPKSPRPCWNGDSRAFGMKTSIGNKPRQRRSGFAWSVPKVRHLRALSRPGHKSVVYLRQSLRNATVTACRSAS